MNYMDHRLWSIVNGHEPKQSVVDEEWTVSWTYVNSYGLKWTLQWTKVNGHGLKVDGFMDRNTRSKMELNWKFKT